jgi:hypothetical protein
MVDWEVGKRAVYCAGPWTSGVPGFESWTLSSEFNDGDVCVGTATEWGGGPWHLVLRSLRPPVAGEKGSMLSRSQEHVV